MRHQFIGFSIIGILALFFLFAPDLASAADCASVPAGGNYTVSTSCTFAGTVDGVDNGNLTIDADKTLTINAGQTVVWNSGFSITISGEIAIAVGATGLRKTNLWMVDGDSDGYPLNTTQTAQDSDPGGGSRRRNLITNYTTVDVADGDGTCYQNLSCYSAVSCEQSGPASQCVAANCEANGYFTNAPTFTVFATNVETYKGSTAGGATDDGAGADAICQAAADGAGISGSYTAWLSDGTADEPADRSLADCATAGASSVAWYLPDGTTKVVDNWGDLTDGVDGIDAAINKDEDGNTFTATDVWTGTDADGAANGSNCDSWASGAGNKSGAYGNEDSSTTAWTATGTAACNSGMRLYCFQHAP